jgi:hypothetical protein
MTTSQRLLFLIICLFATNAIAQDAVKEKASSSIKVIEDPFAKQIAKHIQPNPLKKQLTFFADPVTKGRGTQQDGIVAARNFIISQLKSGSGPNQLTTPLPYTIKGTKWKSVKITMGGLKLTLNQDFWLEPSFSNYQAINTRRYKFNPEIANPNAKRLYQNHEIIGIPAKAFSAKPSRENGDNIRAIHSAGIRVGFLVVPDTDKVLMPGKALVNYRSLRTLKSDTADTRQNNKTIIYIKESTWKKLEKAAKDLQAKTDTVSLSIEAIPEQNVDFTEYNILHLFKGIDTTKTVVISAHYDHLGYELGTWNAGADDDGSGSIGLLSIAQAFQKGEEAGWRPGTNIALIWFSGEERGLLGSDAYSENPYFPMAQTMVDINIDMIGRCDTAHEKTQKDFIYVIGSNFVSQDLDSYVTQVNNMYTHLPLDYRYNTPKDPNRFYFRSDHYNFAKNSVPCVFFFNGVHIDYHKPTDTPDRIDYESFAKRVRLTLFLATHLCRRTEMLPANGLGIK